MASKETEYGFKWEQNGIRTVIQRTFCDSKHMCWTIFSDAGMIDICVTPSGQFRVGPVRKPTSKRPFKVDRKYLKEIMEQ